MFCESDVCVLGMMGFVYLCMWLIGVDGQAVVGMDRVKMVGRVRGDTEPASVALANQLLPSSLPVAAAHVQKKGQLIQRCPRSWRPRVREARLMQVCPPTPRQPAAPVPQVKLMQEFPQRHHQTCPFLRYPLQLSANNAMQVPMPSVNFATQRFV